MENKKLANSTPETESKDETIIDAETPDIREPESIKTASGFDKKTIFAPGGDLDALDLFDSFSETQLGEDLIEPIGLIDVPEADRGDTESGNDFLSQLERGFLSPPNENTADRFTDGGTDRCDTVPAGQGDGIFSDSEPEAIAAVTPEQLEAALERVIDRIFTQRIEAILREVLEKAVSEEIGKFRGALLDNIAVDDDL